MTTLELSEALAQRSRDTHRTVQLLDAVIVNVQAAPPIGSLRDMLLRSLYIHADSDNEQVLVAVARAMLTVRVNRRRDHDRTGGAPQRQSAQHAAALTVRARRRQRRAIARGSG